MGKKGNLLANLVFEAPAEPVTVASLPQNSGPPVLTLPRVSHIAAIAYDISPDSFDDYDVEDSAAQNSTPTFPPTIARISSLAMQDRFDFIVNEGSVPHVQPEGGSKDVFVHISALERAGMVLLSQGDVILVPERHVFDAGLAADLDAAVDAAGNTLGPSAHPSSGDFFIG